MTYEIYPGSLYDYTAGVRCGVLVKEDVMRKLSKLQAERAEREKAEAQQREAQAKADAERKAAEAVAEEQRRVAAQAAADAKEAERRERDKAHKTAVNRAALDAFVQGGMTEECAKLAVTLIAKKVIPSVSIVY